MASKRSNTTEPESGTAKVNRLSIPLKADGVSIDYEQMRPSTREKLKAAVDSTPEVIKLLDPEGAAAVGVGVEEEIPDIFGGITEENIRSGLDMLTGINARVFAMLGGKFIKHPFLKDEKGHPVPIQFDPKLVADCFTLTSAQHAELDPRALRIAKKHGNVLPEWFKKNMDLYMLGMMFFKYQGENALAAIQAQCKVDFVAVQKIQQAQQPSKANGRAPEPQPIRITEVPPAGEGATA